MESQAKRACSHSWRTCTWAGKIQIEELNVYSYKAYPRTSQVCLQPQLAPVQPGKKKYEGIGCVAAHAVHKAKLIVHAA
jgi:hypothetical protein